MNKVKILDRQFQISICSDDIRKRVTSIAHELNANYSNENIIFMSILNGAFMFASDLFRQIDFQCEISFLKLATYLGTSSSGTVKRLIGMNENIKDKVVVILEDIIDSGNTLNDVMKQLTGYEPAKIEIVTLLFKPDAYQLEIPVQYIGFNVSNEFYIGYGLDYKGYGRNLNSIYKII